MRKILHIDMDCFYAAIECRDDPSIADKPVGVGGTGRRSVLTTCNYEARKFGCRSAMPGWKARELCPQLVFLPVRFDLYREESRRIRQVFAQFTDLIEPLSLDEAFLDLDKYAISGVKVIDRYTYSVKIKGKYPQFLYWLAMPCFAPAWNWMYSFQISSICVSSSHGNRCSYPMRRATSIICHVSLIDSPGGGTS